MEAGIEIDIFSDLGVIFHPNMYVWKSMDDTPAFDWYIKVFASTSHDLVLVRFRIGFLFRNLLNRHVSNMAENCQLLRNIFHM